MKLNNLLTPPMQHCEDATAHLLKALNIKFTRSHLQKELTEHPDYPSLAAIADVIGISYDVACAPVKIAIEDFENSPDFRLPFLAQVRPADLRHDVFAVVTAFTGDTIDLYNPGSENQEIHTLVSFNKMYKGRMLIVEAGGKMEEDGYANHLKKEKQNLFFNAFALWALPVLTLMVCGFYVTNHRLAIAVAPVLFTMLALAGTIITTLLLWHEIDEYNPVVKQVCQASAKVNCSAVLHSAASKIMGISWSSLGFVYFTGMLLSLLSTGVSQNAILLSAWISVPALCYPVFSIYYQWKVVKQWCLLCLMVQGILVLLFITAFLGGFYNIAAITSLPVYTIAGYLSSFLVVFVAMIVLIPALQKAKTSRQKTIELQRMKHNPQIFEGLLAKQKAINKPADDLGIIIGKTDSVYRLVKICNPYCGPCAKAHPAMEELVNNNDEVSLQVIFTASNDEKDIKREPVMHLMGIASKGDEALTKQALDDWYLSPEKDYRKFAAQYPMNGELAMQVENIRKMKEWCDKTQISFTPTFFLSFNNNNADSEFYQLPEMYSVSDLKYFFTI